MVVAGLGYQSHAIRNAIVPTPNPNPIPKLITASHVARSVVTILNPRPCLVSGRRRVLRRSIVAIVGGLRLLQLNVVAAVVVGSVGRRAVSCDACQ